MLFSQKNKPNILFINVDDYGATDVGFMGQKVYLTPNMDNFAKQGVIFDNGYAGSANCAPSRACLMTGQTTSRHGILTVAPSERGKAFTRKLTPIQTRKYLNNRTLTMGDIFKRNGYQTAVFGKWHISKDAKENGFDYTVAAGPAGHPKTYFSPFYLYNLPDHKDGEYLTDRLTDEAIHYLKVKRKQDKPFFIYHFMLCTSPYRLKLNYVLNTWVKFNLMDIL